MKINNKQTSTSKQLPFDNAIFECSCTIFTGNLEILCFHGELWKRWDGGKPEIRKKALEAHAGKNKLPNLLMYKTRIQNIYKT